MSDTGELIHSLRNIPVRELISAIERDGFILRRTTRTGGQIYAHPKDERMVVIHYHHSSETLRRKTLKSILEGTRWSKDDLQRLGLIH